MGAQGEGGGWNGPKKADTTAGTGPPAVTKVILRRVPQNTDSTFEIHVGILITESGGGCLVSFEDKLHLQAFLCL